MSLALEPLGPQQGVDEIDEQPARSTMAASVKSNVIDASSEPVAGVGIDPGKREEAQAEGQGMRSNMWKSLRKAGPKIDASRLHRLTCVNKGRGGAPTHHAAIPATCGTQIFESRRRASFIGIA